MNPTRAAVVDPMRVRGLHHRLGARLLLDFLLLTTCVLFLHLQSAKDRCEYLLNTTHVVHGDLEVESERPAHVFTRVFSTAPLAARVVLASSWPFPSAHVFQAFALPLLPVRDLTKIRLARHLARLFHAPPAV